MELGGGAVPGVPWKWCEVSDRALQLSPPTWDVTTAEWPALILSQQDNLSGWELLSSSFGFLSSQLWNLGVEGARAVLEAQGGEAVQVWAGRSSVLQHLTAVLALLPPSPLFQLIFWGILILAHYFGPAGGWQGAQKRGLLEAEAWKCQGFCEFLWLQGL